MTLHAISENGIAKPFEGIIICACIGKMVYIEINSQMAYPCRLSLVASNYMFYAYQVEINLKLIRKETKYDKKNEKSKGY